MDGAIPKRASSDAASTPKAEPSLLSSLPPPPAPSVPTQQKKAQHQTSQQQRPQPASRTGSETISLPQVSSTSTYQPRPKTTVLTDREKRMVKKLDELAGIVSSNMTETTDNVLTVDPREFMQRENRQSGSIDLFGSFITNSENQYDFFDTDAVTNTVNITPLPNGRIPIFPEDFPPNGKKEWPLKWWGIHQPSEKLLQLHDEKALSLGYPVSHRKGGSPGSKIQPTSEKSRGGESNKDSKSSSKKESESRRRKRSGDSSKERSRKRHHSDDRRHRRS